MIVWQRSNVKGTYMTNVWIFNHYAVPPKYYPLARDTNFARHLIERGYKVTIFAASTVHNSNINLSDDSTPYRVLSDNGINYVLIKCPNYSGNGLSRIINVLAFINALPKVCSQLPRPDIIIASSITPLTCKVGISIAKKYHCPCIAQITDLWPEALIPMIPGGKSNPIIHVIRNMEKRIYIEADAIIFSMEGGYDYITDQHWENMIPRSKVYYINNGIELVDFNENKMKYIVEDKDLDDNSTFKVVYAGSIRKFNDIGMILDTAKFIKNRKIKIYIWGDGDERENLEKRVKDENIGNVYFKGHVDKKYIPSIVSRADLNIINVQVNNVLKYGVSPNKLFDYFAAGKPILCNFHTKFNPTIQYQAGFESSHQSPKETATIIEDIYSLPREEYNQLCDNAKRAAEHFDFNSLTNQLIGIIENCLFK